MEHPGTWPIRSAYGQVKCNAPSLPSTKVIAADEGFCAQVAALLLCEPEPIGDAFVGEPAEEVLEMVRWALRHEGDEGFDAVRALPNWARRRGRGRWRAERPNGADGRA